MSIKLPLKSFLITNSADLTLASVDTSGMALFGTGLLPPLVITKDPEWEFFDFELSEEQVKLEGGFEANLGGTAGYLWTEENALEQLTAPLPQPIRTGQVPRSWKDPASFSAACAP